MRVFSLPLCERWKAVGPSRLGSECCPPAQESDADCRVINNRMLMDASEEKLFSALCETLCAAVEKARAEALSLTDMYVQVKYDEQLFTVFDDGDGVLAQSTIDELDEWRTAHDGDQLDAALIAFLRKVLADERLCQAIHSLVVISPFSVVLVNADMEPVADLITLDDENIYLHDDFWEKMDKELDDFFDQLMADTK